jgi:CRP-like cAMP-binding protein
MNTELIKTENAIFRSIPPEDWQRLVDHLEPVELALGKVLYEPGTKMSHVYFPSTAIVSLLYALENGSSAEIAVVGLEGVVGISIFMGGESTSSRAVTQSAGLGYRIPSGVILKEFNRSGPVMHLLLRYNAGVRGPGAHAGAAEDHRRYP